MYLLIGLFMLIRIKRTAPKFNFMVTVTAILFLLVALCVNKHLIDFINVLVKI